MCFTCEIRANTWGIMIVASLDFGVGVMKYICYFFPIDMIMCVSVLY